MCKHVLNAQFMLWTGKDWYDCVLCHAEANGGAAYVPSGTVMSMRCKKCLQVFRKDFSCVSSHDHQCPHCNNLLFLDAEFPADERDAPTSAVREASQAASLLDGKPPPGGKGDRSGGGSGGGGGGGAGTGAGGGGGESEGGRALPAIRDAQ